uniref:Capsid protein n=1 Tax=Cressdnaviricota sp. TaxID=2748378 RepID=A0A7G8LJ11_9VIRU|nr:capsid protein [Cressdnaviricota sp.]
MGYYSRRKHVRRAIGAVSSYAARKGASWLGKRKRTSTRMAHKNKRSRTRTRTSTKRRKSALMVSNVGKDVSYCGIFKKARFMKAKYLTGATQTYKTMAGSALQSLQGKQGLTSFPGAQLFTGADLMAIWNEMAARSIDTTNTGTYGTVLTNNNGSAKLFVHSGMWTGEFTNTSNVGVWLTIYDTVPRKDELITDSYDLTPDTSIATGLSEENFATTANEIGLGVTPFMSHGFCTQWKVIKVNKIFINPGFTHKHSIFVKQNKWIDAHTISLSPIAGGLGITAANRKGTFKGWTVFPMCMFHGTPVHSLATPTNVTAPAVQLDVIFTRTYKWQRYEPTATGYRVADTMITNMADPHTVAEDANVDTAVVQN